MRLFTQGPKALARRAAEVRRYRILIRIVPAIMAALATLVGLVYTVSVMYTKLGSFTITVNKYHSLEYGLALCEHADFLNSSPRLDCQAAEEITNIDGRTLDNIAFGAEDGNDSKDNYLCYTFYCKNTGEKQIDFEYAINIANQTEGIDKACRVRLITSRNGGLKTQTDYARAAGVDEYGNAIPEEGTTPFYSKGMVMTETVRAFEPNEIIKYTVVIWLEGPDTECVDDILGGQFKVDMKFNVTAVDGEELTLLDE